MAAVTTAGMLAAEAAAQCMGWTEESLVNLAGERLGRALGRFFPVPGMVVAYLGKGHNAADALVALRILRDQFGWKIAARNAFPIDACSPLTQKKWLDLALDSPLHTQPPWRDLEGPLLLLDGLLGSGSRGAMREPLLGLAAEMAHLRHHAGARVAAVDQPSGVDADTGLSSPGAVCADITFMIGNAKLGLLYGHAAISTGSLALVPVEVLAVPDPGGAELIAPQTLNCAKSRRPFDFHKGLAGSVAILAGSDRYMGAAALAATGALRGGAGRITLLVPQALVAPTAARCPPEIIIQGFHSLHDVLNLNADAWVVGCGIGDLDADSATFLLDWISDRPSPVVIDADALNLIAKSGKIGILREHHVVTPHPGEFKRMAPDLANLPREAAAAAFAGRVPATLLLKGCRTIVARAGSPLWCNSTGSPGMATGGQGDLLSGVIGALLAIGNSPLEAASLASWLCGRAAEIALSDSRTSEESLTPGDVASCLGGAFSDWRHSRR